MEQPLMSSLTFIDGRSPQLPEFLQQFPPQGRLSADWPIVPYLSLKDNLHLGLNKKQVMEKQAELFQLLQLDPSLLQKNVADLAFLEQIVLRLYRCLLQDCHQIVCLGILDQLTTEEAFTLVHLCQTISQQRNCCFTFVTCDDNLLSKLPADTLLSL